MIVDRRYWKRTEPTMRILMRRYMDWTGWVFKLAYEPIEDEF